MSKFRNFLHFSFYLPFLSVASLQASDLSCFEGRSMQAKIAFMASLSAEIEKDMLALVEKAHDALALQGILPKMHEYDHKNAKIKRFGYRPSHPDHVKKIHAKGLKVHGNDAYEKLKAVAFPANYRLPNVDQVPVFDQGQQGSCTANSSMAIVRYLSLANNGVQNMLNPSRSAQYWKAREFAQNDDPNSGISTTDDTGATLASSILAIDEYGCSPEVINLNEGEVNISVGDYIMQYTGMPYDDQVFNVQPSSYDYRVMFSSFKSGLNANSAYISGVNQGTILPQGCIQYSDVGNIIQYLDLAAPYKLQGMNPYTPQPNFVASLKAALSQGCPIYIGVMLDNSFQNNPQTGVVPMPNIKTFKPEGGHAIWLTGYGKNANGGYNGYFEFRNSWAGTWGNKGYGYFPESYMSYPLVFGIEAYQVSFDLTKMQFKK